MALNRVLSGDYAGRQVVGGGVANAGISLGFIKQLYLNRTTVESYEVLGGMAEATMKKGTYQLSIQFKDGKRSLLEVDEKLYKAIVQACFLNQDKKIKPPVVQHRRL